MLLFNRFLSINFVKTFVKLSHAYDYITNKATCRNENVIQLDKNNEETNEAESCKNTYRLIDWLE